ncbi:MAG: DUF4202 domain-containing protein [Candidatus Tectomicrobia bacterium]|nr:DUF4202 domain-containing protein [Candidatus Tectomicrobia bacterium]
MTADAKRFEAAIARIDAANAEDPNSEEANGVTHPKELLYGQRMTAWLDRLSPDACEALKLAARAQHIRRWAIPRRDYPMTRTGYLKWRTTLYRFHAEEAAGILREVGYDDATVAAVGSLLRKERLKRDADAQCLEDVACLVFLEHHLADFAPQYDEQKVLAILRKTWKKMSPRGQAAARRFALPQAARVLLDRALSEP